jgi:transcriptional regulator with XRE-family HTH domain
MNFGSQLKKLRLEKGFTLADVSKEIKVTSGFISQIENGKTTPSINSLIDILGFYNVPLSTFFKQLEKEDLIMVRAKDVETIKGKKGICVSLLASKLDNNTLESYRIDITSNEPLNLKSISSEINGERFLIVLNGSVQVNISKNNYTLLSGDSLNFKSHLECKITRLGTKTASIILNGTPPIL